MLGVKFFTPLTFHRNCFPPQRSEDKGPSNGTLERVMERIDIFINPFIEKTILIINRPNKRACCLEVEWTAILDDYSAAFDDEEYVYDTQIGQRSCTFKIVSIILYLLIFPIIIALILKLILRVILHSKYNPVSLLPSHTLPEFSPKQKDRIHELHCSITALANENRCLNDIPKEKLDALGLTLLRHNYINNSERLFFPVFTSREFPGFVFKSLPIERAKASYTSSLISGLLIQDNNLNLLRVPKVLYMDSVVETSFRIRHKNDPEPGKLCESEDCSLVVEEQLSLSFEEPLNRFMDRYGVHAVSTLEQLCIFITKTSFRENYKIRVVDGGSSDTPPVIGLLDVRSVEILPIHPKEGGLSLSLCLWLSRAVGDLSAEQWWTLKRIFCKTLPSEMAFRFMQGYGPDIKRRGIDPEKFLDPKTFKKE